MQSDEPLSKAFNLSRVCKPQFTREQVQWAWEKMLSAVYIPGVRGMFKSNT